MKNHVISDAELKELLDKSPAERVTLDYIYSRIKDIEYHRLGDTVTVCNITLDNGFSVRGESACASPENYNQAIGEKVSYEDGFKKLWPLFGFLLKEKIHLRAAA